MNGTVPVLSIVCMAVSLVIAFGVPIALFIYFRKKKGADILPFFIGCAVMFVFAFVLEAYAHQAVFASEIGKKIQNNVFAYALYGGFMAGLFEETGRFLAFKTVLKKKLGNDANALMYGAGHGGFEAIYLLGITSINNIIYSVLKAFADEHMELETEWDLYRCNLEAAAAGKLRIIVPVKEALPLLFDKDCRKVYKKLKKAKSKLA